MKKIIAVMIAMFTIGTSVYALEVSVGASVGLGPSFLRGEDAKTFDKMYSTVYGKPMGVNFYPQLDVMVEFLPFLALETGLGSKIISTVSYQDTNNPDSVQANFQKFLNFNIPIMIRGQYEYSLGVTYASVGVRLGFNLIGSDYHFLSGLPEGSSTEEASLFKSSPFNMDIAFAVGQEFRLGDANYLGIRIGYDLNVIRPYDTKALNDIGLESPSLFHDDITFSLTYRYAFGSKWKS